MIFKFLKMIQRYINFKLTLRFTRISTQNLQNHSTFCNLLKIKTYLKNVQVPWVFFNFFFRSFFFFFALPTNKYRNCLYNAVLPQILAWGGGSGGSTGRVLPPRQAQADAAGWTQVLFPFPSAGWPSVFFCYLSWGVFFCNSLVIWLNADHDSRMIRRGGLG